MYNISTYLITSITRIKGQILEQPTGSDVILLFIGIGKYINNCLISIYYMNVLMEGK